MDHKCLFQREVQLSLGTVLVWNMAEGLQMSGEKAGNLLTTGGLISIARRTHIIDRWEIRKSK